MAATPAMGQEEFDARGDRQDARRKALWLTAGLALAVLYPFLDRALGIDRLGAWIAIFVFVILGMGLNIVVGYAGLLDLGYVAFFVIGAYSNALLTSPNSVLNRNDLVPGVLQSFWPAMAVSWLVAALFGVLLGAPTLRLRGDYLAIVTLGFGEIVPNFFTNAESATGGPSGISTIARPPTIPLPGGNDITFATTDQRNWYWLILAVGVLTVFLITRLYDSRLGRSWQAIREDEIAAASMGINLVKAKLLAFSLGASFSGFAGGLYAGYLTVVYPDQFQFSVSVMLLAMVILGGMGNVYGVIVGGLLIQSFDRILAEELNRPLHWLGERTGLVFLQEHNVAQDRLLIFGLALVLVMLLRPGGLLPNARRRAELTETAPDPLAEATAAQQVVEARGGDVATAGERA